MVPLCIPILFEVIKRPQLLVINNVAPRLRSIEWYRENRYTHLENKTYRSMWFWFILHEFYEQLRKWVIESLFTQWESYWSLLRPWLCSLCDLWLCYNINVLVPATLACYLWPRVMCSKGARLGNQLDLGIRAMEDY